MSQEHRTACEETLNTLDTQAQRHMLHTDQHRHTQTGVRPAERNIGASCRVWLGDLLSGRASKAEIHLYTIQENTFYRADGIGQPD